MLMTSCLTSQSCTVFTRLRKEVREYSIFTWPSLMQRLVLRWLAGYTMSGAEFDARGHVPSCHPGTRIAILESLYN